MQASILAGDEFTGVSIMLMEPSMDTGPVLGQIVTRIEDEDSLPELEHRLAHSGANLLMSVLPCYLSRAVVAVPQDPAEATYAPLIDKQAGLIDWNQPAKRIWLANRAYQPWPGTHTYWEGHLLKIVSCTPETALSNNAPPGTVLALSKGRGAVVTTGSGVLRLDEVALEGSRAMTIQQFLAGHRSFVGATLTGKNGAE